MKLLLEVDKNSKQLDSTQNTIIQTYHSIYIGNIDVLSGNYSVREKYTFAPGYCREQRRKKLFLSKGNVQYILVLVVILYQSISMISYEIETLCIWWFLRNVPAGLPHHESRLY